MIERKRHEWYLDGGKDKFVCRHCGIKVASRNVNDANKQKCVWPNPSIQENKKEDKLISCVVTVTFDMNYLIHTSDLANFYGKGDGITLKEYIKVMIEDNNFFDTIDYETMKLVSVTDKS